MTSSQQHDNSSKGRVAVLGLGISGIVQVKNLVEQGFQVVGFERNDYYGGLWKYNEDKEQISVLKNTIANTSKYFGHYTDFSFNDDVPTYPRASDIYSNLQDYVNHFDLLQYMRLGIVITLLERSQDGQAWNVHYTSDEKDIVERFDKVVVCTGPWERSYKPKYKGEADFKGEFVMGKEYKGPEEYVGKRVVIVGMSYTACDTAVDLAGVAKEVYMSHRSGIRICPRIVDGKAFDTKVTRQLSSLMTFFDKYIPWLGDYIPNKVMVSNMLKVYPNLKPEWRLLPAPAFKNTWGVINDHIIDKFTSGEVIPLNGIKSFTSNGIITEDFDGKEVHTEVDVVIFCTGAYFDYSNLSPEANPASHQPKEWENLEHSNGLLYPRLYQNIFHPQFIDSLAFIGPCKGFSFAIHPNSDLISQAITQVFAGNLNSANKLPQNKVEVDEWCEGNYHANVRLVKRWRTFRTGPTIARDFESFLNDVAGTSVNEYLGGWGWKAWKFWWYNRELYGLLVRGVNSPAQYRLFKGNGRKQWDGAVELIYKANGREMPERYQGRAFEW
ncbi:hypothetical protein V865_003461 [Kwoniella europaea PYCC6329]|uniref:Dimethylaniline monooxygenase n=1 Tax=Kwoniella europaea PYCC6329 TaxID=1423913 RepID=A0AAX4KG91_9TREE